MAQPPWLVDVLQIEPGSGDTITVDRDATDGAMQFVDAVVTSGVLLPALVGIRNITGVFVVGRAGDGAPYTTVQAALDAIPAASSALVPSLVLIMPGVYTEDLTLTRDGVYMVGLGGAKLINSTGTHTLTIKAESTSTPQNILLKGLEIECDHAGDACVYVLGADTFASGTVDVDNAPLTAGDLITVGGVALTGVSGTRTSGSDDFSVNGVTTDEIAAEIVDAIMDSANSFTNVVTAVSALNVVTFSAVTAGTVGNAITLAVTVAVPGDLAPSGATLAGGGSSGNVVADGALTIEDCVLVASGAGCYQVDADTANHIRVRGGTFRGSSATSIFQASNTAAVRLEGIEWMNDFQLAYDNTLDQPNDVTSEYQIVNCGRIHDLLANFVGLGSLTISNCPDISVLAQDGDQTLALNNCVVGGATTLGTTTAATFRNTERGTLAVSGGTPTLAESRFMGSQAFAGTTTQTITFDIQQPDTSYTVLIEVGPAGAGNVMAATNKTATTFDIEEVNGPFAVTATINYVICRDL